MGFSSLMIHSVAVLAGQVRQEEQVVTELRYLPEGWVAVGVTALVAALLWCVVYMYRHEGRVGASGRVRGLLALIRCVILLLLCLIIFEPVSVRILRRWIDSYTVVLVDNSSSMDLADNYRDADAGQRVAKLMGTSSDGSPRRRDIARRILTEDDRSFLRELSENNRVKLYRFGDQIELAASIRATREGHAVRTLDRGKVDSAQRGSLEDVADADLDLDSSDAVTNIERALRRSVESMGNAPIAGVVVLSDGAFNQGAPVEEVARFARERNLAIHTVGLGDPSPPRNVSVTEIVAPESVVLDDPFAITVSVAADGAVGESLDVTLLERNTSDGSAEKAVERKRVAVRAGARIDPILFQRKQEREGRYVYTARVEPLAGESVTEDNARQVAIQVIDAKTRVLIVAGGPSWDYRYLTRLLQRDETVDVSCWLESADLSAVRDGNTVIDHLPTESEELFEYDVVILLDPGGEEIDEAWCRRVDTLVTEYGGGLLYAAARPHTPDFMRDRRFRAIRDLLPVTLDPEADLVLNQIGHYQTTPSPIVIPEASYAHSVLRLADDPVATKLAWKGVAEVYWHYPVLREKPVATVLMRDGDARMRNSFGGHVLAAVQYVGAGRTAFLGFDSMWRWRRHGERIYNRFWIQLVRYLSEGKLLGGSKRATLLVENERPSLGEVVNVSARLLDARYQPLHRDRIDARVEVNGDRHPFTLAAQPERPGWYDGRFIPDRVGNYRVSVRLPATATNEPIIAERDVIVSRPNLEILNPRMNKAGLITLAEQSQGGRYWEVDQAGNIPKEIPDLHEEIPVRSRPRTLWDNGTVLALLVGLMALEWAIRKWNRLL